MSECLISKLTDKKIEDVNLLMFDHIKSPIEIVNNICTFLISNGGKRIRPRVSILIAGLLNIIDKQEILNFSASIEILHTATLMHDDVIDNSSLRRGKKSTNEKFGNTLAVLGGDFLFTKAYELILSSANTRILKEISSTMQILVQGEMEQMSNIANNFISEETYMRTIYSKTSVLFELSAKIIGIFAESNQNTINSLASYGKAIGNAFQITDDILDYTSDNSTLGKQIGDDLSENKTTLPIIYAIDSLKNTPNYNSLLSAIENKDINTIVKYITQTNADKRCLEKAQKEISIAIDSLNNFQNNEYKTALIELAQGIIIRKN
ncbi:MAG: polyprenyl synthetase family protein [Succinivibrionaceae bacterium]